MWCHCNEITLIAQHKYFSKFMQAWIQMPLQWRRVSEITSQIIVNSTFCLKNLLRLINKTHHVDHIILFTKGESCRKHVMIKFVKNVRCDSNKSDRSHAEGFTSLTRLVVKWCAVWNDNVQRRAKKNSYDAPQERDIIIQYQIPALSRVTWGYGASSVPWRLLIPSTRTLDFSWKWK